jgi:predicted Co/Zn/Cd cation transporter (cation efflux family)
MEPHPPILPPPAQQRRGLTVIDGALALIAILLIVQMWLLTATLESFLAGHREAALPSAIASGALATACFGLYWFVRGVDREGRK